MEYKNIAIEKNCKKTRCFCNYSVVKVFRSKGGDYSREAINRGTAIIRGNTAIELFSSINRSATWVKPLYAFIETELGRTSRWDRVEQWLEEINIRGQ